VTGDGAVAIGPEGFRELPERLVEAFNTNRTYENQVERMIPTIEE
jgi:hypothetical protein